MLRQCFFLVCVLWLFCSVGLPITVGSDTSHSDIAKDWERYKNSEEGKLREKSCSECMERCKEYYRLKGDPHDFRNLVNEASCMIKCTEKYPVPEKYQGYIRSVNKREANFNK